MGVIDVANHCYRDGEYSVRPMVNQDEFPGWPGYVVEYTYWYFDRDGEKDCRTDRVKWHSTYKEADLHRHKLETEGK